MKVPANGWRGRAQREERVAAMAGVVVLHLLLAILVLSGSGIRLPPPREPALRIVTLQPPAPPDADRARTRRVARQEAAAPPAAPAVPKPIVALPSPIRRPVVLAAAPVAGRGAAARAGAGRAGPGTGAGGSGDGLGAGGGGAGGARAQWISGGLNNQDYPDSAKRAGLQGTIAVRFIVRTDGRVEDCRVDRSTGSAALDRLTCTLVEQRMLYAPARDGSGRPVEELAGRTFSFVLTPRRL